MSKICAILVLACIAVVVSCQRNADMEQVKQDIKYMKEYVSAMQVYCDSMRSIQSKLWQINWKTHPEQMQEMFKDPRIAQDTFPIPKPPGPPGPHEPRPQVK